MITRRPASVTLNAIFIKALVDFVTLTDYQRIRENWQSLILGVVHRQSPSRRFTSPLERGHISEGTVMFAKILFCQLAAEGLEAEEQAMETFDRLANLNCPAIIPALPWTDSLAKIATDQPGMTLSELVRDIRLFGDRCHFVHVGRYRQNYADEPTLNREEGRRHAVLRDPWQLITQRKWTELAERFEVDIRWLGRTRRFRTLQEEQLNQFAINQLEYYRNVIFELIEVEDLGGQISVLSVTVHQIWLAPIQENFTMTRIVIPQ